MSGYDVAVIGAGPAGLAAAVSALERGARVLCVDAGAQPGGQFWRHRSEAVMPDDGALHHGWAMYRALRARFDAGAAAGALTYLPGTSVWMVQQVPGGGFELFVTDTVSGAAVQTRSTAQSGSAAQGGAAGWGGQPAATAPLRAATLVLATGGYDRQVPVPGWDLPGVMAAGGIQATIKGSGVLPGRRVLLAGTGPFLLPVAANVLAADGEVVAICEAASLTGWLPGVGAALGVPGKAVEGAGYVRHLLRHRVPYRRSTVLTGIEEADGGTLRATTVRVDADGHARPGTERVIEDLDVVGLGVGFTPQVELGLQLGAGTRVGEDGSLILVADAAQESTVPGLYVAGEACGVGGAVLSVTEGHVAGRCAAVASGARALVAGDGARGADEDAAVQEAGAEAPAGPAAASGTDHGPTAASCTGADHGPTAAEARILRRQRAFATAMHAAHPVPPGWQDRLAPDTTVCRCEEVTAGEILAARQDAHASDARAAKQVTRAGMGWCQGRMCGFATACLAAGAEPGAEPGADGLADAARRPVAAPVTLAALAADPDPHDNADRAE